LEVLQWAREQGCPCNEEVCSLAAMVSRMVVLPYEI
jgi:hypothetical protein